MLERAILITDPTTLGRPLPDFSRLYFGQEFCEKLLPAGEDFVRAIAVARGSGMAFTAVTPFVTDSGIQSIRKLLGGVVSREAEGCEVVVNDWGVFRLLREEFPSMVPILGRLMNKQKRDPRLLRDRSGFQDNQYRGQEVVRWLTGNGISRVSFDNVPQQKGCAPPLKGCLHYPFVFISATRSCALAGWESRMERGAMGVFPCSLECKKQNVVIRRKGMPCPMLLRGAAILFRNDRLPPNLEELGIDRTIFQPEEQV